MACLKTSVKYLLRDLSCHFIFSSVSWLLVLFYPGGLFVLITGAREKVIPRYSGELGGHVLS